MKRWTLLFVLAGTLLPTGAWIVFESKLQALSSKQESRHGDGAFRLMGAYYDLGRYATTLLLNNKGPDPLHVQMRLFAPDGSQWEADAVEVPGSSFLSLDLKAHLARAPDRFHRGSIELSYEGHFLELGAQLRHFDVRGDGAFSEQLSRPEGFASSRLLAR